MRGLRSASGLSDLSLLGERGRARPLGSLPVENREEGGTLRVMREKKDYGTQRTGARKPTTRVEGSQTQAQTVLEERGGVGVDEKTDLLRTDRDDILLRNDQCDVLCELINRRCARLKA